MLKSEKTKTAAMPRVPRALFLIHVDAYFTGFIELVRYLKTDGRLEPWLLFPRWYPNIEPHLRKCEQEGIFFRRLAGGAPVPGSVIRNIPVLGEVMSLRSQLEAARAALQEISPDVIVLGGIIVGHDMAVYIKAARSLGIRIVVLPSWMASAREPAELNLRNPIYSMRRLGNRIFAALAPRWVHEHRGTRLLRLPAAHAAALELLGMAPPLPWVLHSGDADAIGVESSAARDFGVREGLPVARMEVVGSRTHDTLAQVLRDSAQLRQKLLGDRAMPRRRWLLLAAIPPDMLGTVGGRPECEFSDYPALVRAWVASLVAVPDANVVVSIHPSADRSLVGLIEERGARVPDRPVAELIPLCDVYVAAISATIQWAIACGKPTINYDVYRYGYLDYAAVPGVLAANSLEQFRQLLSKLTGDSDYYLQVCQLQRSASAAWGRLDDSAGDRIVALLSRLAAKSTHARAEE